MDPPSLINGVRGGGAGAGEGGGGRFPIPDAAAPPFNLAEIWPFQLNGGNEALFGQGSAGISPYCNGSGVNHEAIGDSGPLSLEQRVSPRGGRKRRDLADDSVKGSGGGASTSNGGDALLQNDCDLKRLKPSGGDNEGGEGNEAGPSSAKTAAKPQEPPKQDYIHVRARRGQATDSHSLAERARREKISERMKILQDLVPGCNKVIGKALVLDEIINYIQSLQRQVEFLSMKLEAVNSRLTPGLEVFPSKDFGQQSFDAGAIPFVSQAPREYSRGSSPDWLHMQIGGSFDRRT